MFDENHITEICLRGGWAVVVEWCNFVTVMECDLPLSLNDNDRKTSWIKKQTRVGRHP